MTIHMQERVSRATVTEAPQSPDRRWLALTFIALAQLMVALDATVVNIALPSAQGALGFSDTDRQWVITAYTLPLAGLLLLTGRIADRYGHRRVFLVGLVGFAVSSAIAGAATNLELLIAGRILQGGFAALLAPAIMALIGLTFTDPRERAKAFGIYGAVASSGAAVGLILGGTLTEYLNWRWCLYVNLAIALVTFLGSRVALADVRPRSRSRIDLVSGLLTTVGLGGIVFGCGRAVLDGWGSSTVIASLLGGAVLLAAFLRRQSTSGSPLLPLSIVSDRSRVGAYLAMAAAIVASFGAFLVLTYYFQTIKHYTPLRAGLAFLPLTAAILVGSGVIAGRMVTRVPARNLIVPGLLTAALGLALLTQLAPSSGFLAVLLPAQILLGIGIGCVVMPAMSIATTNVDRRDAGAAAAMASTAVQVGGSIGTAILNTVSVTAARDYLAAHGVRAATEAAVHGYGVALTGGAGTLVVAAIAAFVCIRPTGGTVSS